MARPLRIEYEGAFYHVTARGNERKRIFFSKRIGQLFDGLSFSAVSKVYQRMTKAIKKNRTMREKMDKIVSILS